MAWNDTQTAQDEISVSEFNSMVSAINGMGSISAFCAGEATDTLKTIHQFEFPVAVTVLRGYAKCQTAPGGGHNCTITITDGSSPKTFTIADPATTGSDEAINQAYSADTTMTITVQDDHADGNTADIQVLFWYKPT